MAERLSTLVLKSALSPGWSRVSVTSSQWVIGQGANLSEPQFSYETLRELKEIRKIKQVFVFTWLLCSPGKPSRFPNHSLCLWD